LAWCCAGFKSYQEHVCVRPLGPFTCVVGPNGCGKSVFGEAIAFALGGSKRMLRVQNLSSLINERVMRSNNPVAEVRFCVLQSIVSCRFHVSVWCQN
jgi:chromosome segregation ATPase